ATATKLYPFIESGAVKNPGQGTFYAGAFSQLTPKTKLGNTVQQYAPRSYIMQWNLNVQRELARNLTAMVGYVGSRSVHLPFVLSGTDSVIPTKTPEGYLFPSPVASGTT